MVFRHKQAEARLRCEKATRMLEKLVEGTELERLGGYHALRQSFTSVLVAQGKTRCTMAQHGPAA